MLSARFSWKLPSLYCHTSVLMSRRNTPLFSGVDSFLNYIFILIYIFCVSMFNFDKSQILLCTHEDYCY
jgi:hypothetical protein